MADQTDRILHGVASDVGLPSAQVAPAIRLMDDGNTIPFIARYRKEMTGMLDEEQLRRIAERLAYRRNLEARRATILRSLEAQGVLTPALHERVERAETLRRLEDLYRPYKPKRRTRAAIARERGLQPLADLILRQVDGESREALAAPFVSEAVPTVEEALAGARDIVAEIIADDPDVRADLRRLVDRHGLLTVTQADPDRDRKGTYRMYYTFTASVRTLRPYQVLAINRGEREGVLNVALEVPEAEALGVLAQRYPADLASPLADDLLAARKDGYHRLLLPAVEREVRRRLTTLADEHAIGVFATNLRALLLQPPLRGATVMGIDPGYRTGCKLAVVDATGKLLATRTIYLRRRAQAMAILSDLAHRYGVTVIAIGNGTASRETESLVADWLRETSSAIRYTIVNEAGASVYAASPLARRELPDVDVSLRGAVSIARRLQDPLAELVKIEPKAIGVGLYQHDVNQKALAAALDAVVESVVNLVGADLNTASAALLRYISGIGPKLAEAIVAYRDAHGPFPSREALRRVPGVGPKTFQQAAGFVRVPGSAEPLDNTPIHPESYGVARAVLDLVGKPLGDPALPDALRKLRRERSPDELAAALNTGRPTLEDILDALAQPGRDPRDDLTGPVLRGDVLRLEDLRVGMRLQGTVRNVVDFGAFVDIGVKRDGLIHVSKMGPGYVSDPHERVSVGEIVEVEVLDVDLERERISLALVG